MTIEPWGKDDLPLLERLMSDPRMTEHLGGPETPEKIRERQGRYERAEAGDRMFKIVDPASGAAVGSVGYWDKEWRDKHVYEVGWMVLPEFQGRRIAVAATAQAIELARQDRKHLWMHAFPNVENAPSNAAPGGTSSGAEQDTNGGSAGVPTEGQNSASSGSASGTIQ